MNYPLISEYIEAIKSAEDNFEELSYLRPVLGDDGLPLMTSGNFAVVFKMKDGQNGKFYAVKCFTKEQEGRAEAYREIGKELENVSSPYILSIRYLEKELFVDTDQTAETEFPVLLMDWVEGKTLDKYLRENLDDKYALEMLAYRFSLLAQWLIPQPFAHGDLKPDNILVREDGTLVLVDYDGMYVPAMKGQKARELGSPDFRHPLRTENDFDEHIDDFPLVTILLSLKAISFRSDFLEQYGSSDRLLFSEKDYKIISKSRLLNELFPSNDSILNVLVSLFMLVLERSYFPDMLLNYINLTIPQVQEPVNLNTEVTREDLANAWMDEFGVMYSSDRKRLLQASSELTDYSIKPGTFVICDLAFQQKILTSIRIPDSVRSIGKGAFFGCGFTFIHIPDSVTSIGKDAFMGCRFTSIHIPDSVTSIGKGAFSLSSLKSIHLPNNLISIEGHVFWGCKAITSIHIPNGIVSIGDNAFQDCSSLYSVSIPDSVTSIGNRVFEDCKALTSIRVPDSVIDMGYSVFSGCSALTSIQISNNVKNIGNSLFQGCVSLNSIHIPEAVLSIGYNAFSKCGALTSINIPNCITSIGEGAFSECKSLTSLQIPDGVMFIGNSVFRECTALTYIHLPEGITAIGEETFIFCDSLTSIYIPNSVTSIGKNAFCGCASLTSIHIPDSITSIGDGAFSGCNSLTSLQIPNGVISIGYCAFSCCEVLTSIFIPDSVTIIDVSAFFGCVSLVSIHIIDGSRKKFEELLPEYKDILIEDL